ncbi:MULTISPECIES: hypothetical protein [unclassified Haloarcula]|uniref:hypothetical protein n=1 Tax=Haloarcula TaxID=2237 RepID=UPI000EF17460|nr:MULTISPECIES: hypothetical protein [unclassified Haloarcula]RLM33314.1 hypothetical protein DVK01_16735 [Haloarcula sp. Atlit-120R]RLM42286.1 hypothetical protein DVK00_18000 [Haloarcula sp. Atlit-47R]RLM95645.1 hypothetical protein D3D01_13155 [Haloarcula sp. Atlit-7R]
MTLDVETPERPALSTGVAADEYDDADVQGDEYRREELAEALDDGAWADAFEEWAADASLDADQWQIVTDLGLIEEFDFFWDSFAGRVGYHAPGLPEDWREREIHPGIDSWGTVSGINAGLTEFGQVVCEVLADEYIDWEAEEVSADDLPDF